jgi:anti-sigma B factor antagonist
MELLTHLENECYQIALRGDLDASSSLLLDDALEKAIACSPRQVYVDCQQLNYISSAGLGVFISHLQNLTESNISLTLYQMTPRVRDVFQLMGMELFLTILPCHPDLLSQPHTGSPGR